MAETESEFRKLFLIYCLDQRPDGQWVALNRRYKPVGFSSTDWIDYEAHPVGFKFKRPLTEAQVRSLSWKGDPSPERIYLYSDSCIPTDGAQAWAAYSARLQLLAGLLVTH